MNLSDTDFGAFGANVTVYDHVMLKFLQVGSILGAVGGLALGAGKGSRKVGLVSRMGRGSVLTMGVAGLASLPVTYYKLSDQDAEQVEDRAYRIRHNMAQRELDFFSQVGFASGAAYGLVISRMGASVPWIRTAALGMASGVLLHVGKRVTSSS